MTSKFKTVKIASQRSDKMINLKEINMFLRRNIARFQIIFGDYYDFDNEKIYLNSKENSQVYKKIYEEQAAFKYFTSIREKNYFSNIQEYKKFLEIVASFVKEIGLKDNSISCSLIIENLIHNGYLSKDDEFKKGKDDDYLDFYAALGFDILNGCGVCRHVADLRKSLFECMNMNGDKLYCNFVKNDDFNYSFKKFQSCCELIRI